MKKTIYWHYSMEELRESAILMREKSAINYHKKILASEEGFKNWVFNFRYECLESIRKYMKLHIKGIVLEIGAGTGIYSCHISKYPKVNLIYSLDYSKMCIEELIPFVIKRFNLQKIEEEKIIPVLGSFNQIKLPNNSVDYVIAMGSLHHSEDREITFKEVYRVLKNDGYLIACERANFNYRDNKYLNEQIDQEYSKDFKIKMGYNQNEKYTRRMNSEHIPLLAEWEYLLAKCGFKNEVYWFLNIPKYRKTRVIGFIWRFFGSFLFRLLGPWLFKRHICQILHIKIPFYPWFSKSKTPDDLLIISKKVSYIRMP